MEPTAIPEQGPSRAGLPRRTRSLLAVLLVVIGAALVDRYAKPIGAFLRLDGLILLARVASPPAPVATKKVIDLHHGHETY